MTPLEYILGLPMVKDFIAEIRTSKIAPLAREHKDAFLLAPAAEKHHHNFSHGLLVHSAEMWQCAKAFADVELPGMASYTHEELFVAVFLHDFAKVLQYEPVGNHAWKWNKMEFQQEVWTLRECAKHCITLTDNELGGLLQAEGSYSKFRLGWRPMSVIVNAADLWSSQVMHQVWDPAAEMKVQCPTCQGNMRNVNGPRGAFFGCLRYPECRGTVDAKEIDADAMFLAWLKRKYSGGPVPSPSTASTVCYGPDDIHDKMEY